MHERIFEGNNKCEEVVVDATQVARQVPELPKPELAIPARELIRRDQSPVSSLPRYFVIEGRPSNPNLEGYIQRKNADNQ